MPKPSKPSTFLNPNGYVTNFEAVLKHELAHPSPPKPKLKPQTEWRVGKCIITLQDRSVGFNVLEKYYAVHDYSGAWYGSFPTFMRAENYAKRE